MIDLHTHTTASDGRCTPADLVARAAAAGVTVLSVTDHDTVAGCAEASAAAPDAGLTLIPGIEVTAVLDDADVHVLGYFFDTGSPVLAAFLAEQRLRRVDRVRHMIDRLASSGIRLDADVILAPGIEDSTRSVGRPWIARALVAAGHVRNTNEAFDRWLSKGRPAFVPRAAAAPAEVIARLHEAGGIASMAHPGLMGLDDRIPEFAAAGLDAIEVYHTKHDDKAVARYRALADRLDLAMSGGSDFHADDMHGGLGPGSVALPRQAFDGLQRRAVLRRSQLADSPHDQR
jgi:3',5'-nucleoside bisphosphate phosphatase